MRNWLRQGALAAAGMVLCLVSPASPASPASPVTLESLLNEMVDVARLSRMPDPPYTTRQASSYDRASTDPAEATEANWFANDDRGQFERIDTLEDGSLEHVLMDAEGPGAIMRIWSANPEDAGIIRVYLDHAATPAIEMPFADLLGGATAPFIGPIAGVRARGWNSYLPIPYAAHCKITASKPSFYYHINYRTYPAETSVETFSLDAAGALSVPIAAVAELLANPTDAPPSLPAEPFLEHPLEMNLPGWSQSEVGFDLAGAVHRLELRVEAEDTEAALRSVLLEIRFDGVAEPFVRVPLGDFFATAPGLNPYRSLVLGVREDGLMYSNWLMPFQRRLELKLVNHSDAPIAVRGRMLIEQHEWTEDTLYFHAKWRHTLDIPTLPRQDLRFVMIEGRGRYVGNMLHVGNPVAAWWGEGGEKIYVDGETFPSTFGTGTGDYYGYAWGDTDRFTHAYHNQPRSDGPQNHGNTLNSRFHVIDDIPFQQSLQFDMELWHLADTTVNIAVTNYWYAAPGATDDTPPIDDALLIVPAIPPMPEPDPEPEPEPMPEAEHEPEPEPEQEAPNAES